MAGDVVHARGRYAPLCWPKEGSQFGESTDRVDEVTCLDCRDVLVRFSEKQTGLGIQEVFNKTGERRE